MAQKEVALMQQRSGKQRDLPNGELGQILFSTDEVRVFIGLPSSVQPASLVAGRTQLNAPNRGNENAEIITEFSPWEVVNALVYRPYNLTVLPNSQANFVVQSTSRLFIDYIAYNDVSTAPAGTETIMESGSVQLMVNAGEVILSQQNNTNKDDGIVNLEFDNPLYNTGTKRLTLTVINKSTTPYAVEYVLRGWDI